MGIDEFKFHRERKLGLWEAWGHPVDSLCYLVPLAIAAMAPGSAGWLTAYCVSSVISSVVITKDEWVHSSGCEPAEHFVHALLFVIHPTILFGLGYLWFTDQGQSLRLVMPLMVGSFGMYQLGYWALWGSWDSSRREKPEIDNSFYDELGDRWYDDDTHAIALLRMESRKKLEYVRKVLAKNKVSRNASILDIGCGAGFISNPLAADGYDLKGIDLSASSVDIARKHAPVGKTVSYEAQNAYALKEGNESRDIVLMLDFLEHVTEPGRAIKEANRVLKPGGLLITHTFNRTLIARLLAVYGIAFVAKETPVHVHLYSLFIKPKELSEMGKALGLETQEFIGIRPRLSRAFFWSIAHRRVHPSFTFVFCDSLKVGYLGYLRKGVTPVSI